MVDILVHRHSKCHPGMQWCHCRRSDSCQCMRIGLSRDLEPFDWPSNECPASRGIGRIHLLGFLLFDKICWRLQLNWFGYLLPCIRFHFERMRRRSIWLNQFRRQHFDIGVPSHPNGRDNRFCRHRPGRTLQDFHHHMSRISMTHLKKYNICEMIVVAFIHTQKCNITLLNSEKRTEKPNNVSKASWSASLKKNSKIEKIVCQFSRLSRNKDVQNGPTKYVDLIWYDYVEEEEQRILLACAT